MKIAKESYYSEVRKLFTLESCWSILRNHKKWSETKPANFGSTEPDNWAGVHPSSGAIEALDSQDTPQTEVRPMGIKNAKKNAASEDLTKKKIKMLELSAREGVKQGKEMSIANKIQEGTNSIQKRQANNKADKNQMERKRMEIEIMEKDVSNMDDLAEEYFQMKKRRILCNFQAQEEKESKEKKKEKSYSLSEPNLYHQSNDQSSEQDPEDQELPDLDLNNIAPHSESQASALRSESQASALRSKDEEIVVQGSVDPSLL
jgi:hypothetical protein